MRHAISYFPATLTDVVLSIREPDDSGTFLFAYSIQRVGHTFYYLHDTLTDTTETYDLLADALADANDNSSAIVICELPNDNTTDTEILYFFH